MEIGLSHRAMECDEMRIAGFGYREGATMTSLREALAEADGTLPDGLAVPADKAAALCVRELAVELNLPLYSVPADAMRRAETLTMSKKVMEKRGTGSVAEACAVAAVGPNAHLEGPRKVSPDRMATCAIAHGEPE